MPIRPEAALHTARGIITAMRPDADEMLIALVASIIVSAVADDERRELRERASLKEVA